MPDRKANLIFTALVITAIAAITAMALYAEGDTRLHRVTHQGVYSTYKTMNYALCKGDTDHCAKGGKFALGANLAKLHEQGFVSFRYGAIRSVRGEVLPYLIY